jgi:F-type H+-transporting ATPase subunit b
MFDETFWVAVAFAAFVGVIVYLKVPAMITKALDERAERIRRELDEARRLREEAQALYAEYQRKQRNALKEAEDIVAHARAEVEHMRETAEAELRASLARRAALAETKIAQAEAAAVKDVRDMAVDVAIAAAGHVLAERLKGAEADRLIEQTTAELRAKLH